MTWINSLKNHHQQGIHEEVFQNKTIMNNTEKKEKHIPA